MKDDNDFTKELWKEEMKSIASIKGLIIQSYRRKQLFIENYQLSQDLKVFMLPVTYKGSSCSLKSNYLRKKHNILNTKDILLHLGGITPENECIELIKSFKNIENWVLVFHGYAEQLYFEQINKFVNREKIQNVIFDNDFSSSIEDVQKVVQSADAGIAWYKNISLNYYTTGESSGKISYYLKCGLPVVANDYPSFKEVIEKQQTGICIKSFENLVSALMNIKENYEYLSANASRTYDKTYKFELYEKRLEKFIFGE